MKSIIVNFNDLGESVYEDKRVTFKRISTRSSVIALDEPLTTEWVWYWVDENNRWQMYNTGSVSTWYSRGFLSSCPFFLTARPG